MENVEYPRALLSKRRGPHCSGSRQYNICCANWNGNSALAVPLPNVIDPNRATSSSLYYADRYQPGETHHQHPSPQPVHHFIDNSVLSSKTFDRPADVCSISFSPDTPGGLAVCDFYGGAVHLYSCPAEHASIFSDPYGGAPMQERQHLAPLFSIKPNPSKRRALERPSAIAVDTTRAHRHASQPTLRLLVAESGKMCISVFELREARPAAGLTRQTRYAHICDIGCGQLGTGVHQPLRSRWSWLGLAVTEAGDVLVADMDRSCVYRL